MSGGWIYVLELAPTGCIKVGRTDDLAQRLSEHLKSAMTYGVSVTRLASYAVDDTTRSEDRLLSALRRNRKARAASSRETFYGISFDEVLRLVDDVRQSPAPAVAEQRVVELVQELSEPDPSVLTAISEVLHGPRERLGDVLTRLRQHDWDKFHGWSQKRLARELEDTWGVRPRKSNGYPVVLAIDIERARQNEGCEDAIEQEDAS